MAICLAALFGNVFSFSPATKHVTARHSLIALSESVESTTSVKQTPASDEEDAPVVNLSVPLSAAEMIRQVSSTMRDAYNQDKKRQIVRILLPRDPNNENLGVLNEGKSDFDSRDAVLVPPDESWQGGIMQLYYSAAPTCKEILRQFSAKLSESGVSPKLVEDRTVDESGVDGVGLWSTESSSSDSSIRCFVQPSTESIDYVESENKEDLVVLVNPQWRSTDDWFDGVSKQDTLFGKMATFLGGKGGVLKQLEEMDYENVYTFEGYICRGYKIRLLKRFDSDWGVFCEQGNGFMKVGTVEDERPSYQQVEKFLDDAGIGFKYAEQMML